jgi:hypothetical protein
MVIPPNPTAEHYAQIDSFMEKWVQLSTRQKYRVHHFLHLALNGNRVRLVKVRS